MPRVNIMIPDHMWEQWCEIPKYRRSQWVQDKLQEEWEREKREIKEASDVTE